MRMLWPIFRMPYRRVMGSVGKIYFPYGCRARILGAMSHRLDTVCLPLFVPADRPERFAKAFAAGADAVLVDLEDAVAPSDKVFARTGLKEALSGMQGPVPVMVRINGVDTPWHEDDLAAIAGLGIDAVMLSKAESAHDVTAVAEGTGLPVFALVESAQGLRDVFEIAGAARRIAFGSIDFAADLAMGHTRDALLYARSLIVHASRVAGIPAPIDGVTRAISDEAAIVADCVHAAELGFSGKLLIHPAQIDPARRGFRPADAEIGWARRVLAAADGGAAVAVDGAMVDAPVLLRARQVLRKAGLDEGRS